jgi:hypothetical protein
MRTTLTLDHDVAVLLEQLRQNRNTRLKDVINEALRRGLRQMLAPAPPITPFHTEPVALGRCLLSDVDNIAEVLAAVDDGVLK